ncbi:hypothetical protein, partial [Streptomyces sp. CBMA370]
VAVATATVAGLVALGALATTRETGRAPGPGPVAAPPTRTPPSAPAPDPGSQTRAAVDVSGNRWWSQSKLTLTTTTPVTALTVEVRIARTPGVVGTGHWHDLPGGDFTTTATEENGHLVYRWTLKPGRTVAPGRHAFAAQYNHAEGTRGASADTYTAVLTGGDGSRSTLRGTFGTPPAR